MTREWFSALARQMFNPGYCLFQPQAADALTYQPSKVSPRRIIELVLPLISRRSLPESIPSIFCSSSSSVASLERLCTISDCSKPTSVDVRPFSPSLRRSDRLLAAVYKHILGKQVDHRDLESIDPEYHKSLVWMLDNPVEGVLDLTFSVERDNFGVVDIVDLIADGRNVTVTDENKAEYVRLIADFRLTTEIKDQISVRFYRCSFSTSR